MASSSDDDDVFISLKRSCAKPMARKKIPVRQVTLESDESASDEEIFLEGTTQKQNAGIVVTKVEIPDINDMDSDMDTDVLNFPSQEWEQGTGQKSEQSGHQSPESRTTLEANSTQAASSKVSDTSLLTTGPDTVKLSDRLSSHVPVIPNSESSAVSSPSKKRKIAVATKDATLPTAGLQHEVRTFTLQEGLTRDRSMELLKLATQESMLADDNERYLSFCRGQEILLTHKTCSPTHTGEPTSCCLDADDDFYGLGPNVKRAVFETFRMKQLHPWQHEMLQEHITAHESRRNCLVLAPTSGGKSLVAYILMLRTVYVEGKDAILALPYISLVDEKARDLQLLASILTASGKISFAVEVYAGPRGRLPVPSRSNSMCTMYVCTFEKAGSVWRNIMNREGSSSASKVALPVEYKIGLVAVDEFHMIGEGKRGSVLEDLVTNILYWSGLSTRLLALSATVGNPDILASFVGCGNPDNSFLYRVSTSTSAHVKENVIVAGGAFPILRKDGAAAAGNVNFQSGKSDGHDVEMDFLEHLCVLGEDPPLLWLKIHQLRLFIERSTLVMINLMSNGLDLVWHLSHLSLKLNVRQQPPIQMIFR